MLNRQEIDVSTQQILQRFRFDEERFESQRRALREGQLGLEANRIGRPIEPPLVGDIMDVQTHSLPEARERGREALSRGEVGAIILAGGMATRFGGVVKAVVDVTHGLSFLELKLRDLHACAEQHGVRLPVYLMTSFATHEDISALAATVSSEHLEVRTFPQEVSLRLDPRGELFRHDNGSCSPYAPGHGDLTFALRRSGDLTRFREAGGRTLVVSNVDNVVATLDPTILGAHLQSGAAITAEVVDREDGDRGGAPARVDGVLQIVEGFRFPPSYDLGRIPVFNTNTLLLQADAIDRDFDLTFFYVEKKVDGRVAIQLERLVGELTAKLPSNYVHVARRGPASRFLPAKDPAELRERLNEIVHVLETRALLR